MRRLPTVALVALLGLLAGGGVALAAWASTGPGTATARAGSLGTTTASATAWVCTGLLGSSTPKFAAAHAVEALPSLALATTTTVAPPVTTTTTAVTTTTPAPTTTGATSGIGTLTSTVSFTAVPTATSYQFQAATTADFAAPVASGSTAATANVVTVRDLVKTTVYLRARAAAGTWTGAWSPTLITSAGPCPL